jgi:hypothetical protein
MDMNTARSGSVSKALPLPLNSPQSKTAHALGPLAVAVYKSRTSGSGTWLWSLSGLVSLGLFALIFYCHSLRYGWSIYINLTLLFK